MRFLAVALVVGVVGAGAAWGQEKAAPPAVRSELVVEKKGEEPRKVLSYALKPGDVYAFEVTLKTEAVEKTEKGEVVTNDTRRTRSVVVAEVGKVEADGAVELKVKVESIESVDEQGKPVKAGPDVAVFFATSRGAKGRMVLSKERLLQSATIGKAASETWAELFLEPLTFVLLPLVDEDVGVKAEWSGPGPSFAPDWAKKPKKPLEPDLISVRVEERGKEDVTLAWERKDAWPPQTMGGMFLLDETLELKITMRGTATFKAGEAMTPTSGEASREIVSKVRDGDGRLISSTIKNTWSIGVKERPGKGGK